MGRGDGASDTTHRCVRCTVTTADSKPLTIALRPVVLVDRRPPVPVLGSTHRGGRPC
jgi:hypothetical protein